MDQSQATLRSSSTSERLDGLSRQFMSQGYLVVPEVVDKTMLVEIHAQISAAFERAKTEGKLFSGGGTLSGHLNCFPGIAARGVYDALEARGIIDRVRALSARPLRLPNVGCNLNLPHSSEQNEHVDGYAATPFLVVNVAVVETTLANGAMEIMPRTQLHEYKYWQLLATRPERVRVCLSAGDVVIRTSALWHRGMPNRTKQPRPMLAFSWEEGGSSRADPFADHGGQISFFPNRFRTDWAGRLRERVFVAAPGLSRAVRAATSLITG